MPLRVFGAGRAHVLLAMLSDCLLRVAVWLWYPCRGLLTGKYKRDEKPTASVGRIGIIAEDEKKAMQCAPAWSKYDGDFYWKLRDGLEQIGKDHGMSYC